MNPRSRDRVQCAAILGLLMIVVLFPSAAFSEPGGASTATPLPWPIKQPFVIGAQMSDFQSYSGVPYLHGGIDLVGSAGMSVYSPVSGTVKIFRYRIDGGREPRRFAYERFPFHPDDPINEYSSRYIEVAVIDDSGRRWMFRHIDGKNISRDLLEAARVGTPVASGTELGRIIPWSESVYPETRRYDHLHLEVIDHEGYYLNPGALLPRLPDDLPPVIHELLLTPNEALGILPTEEDGSVIVSGTIDLLARIEDEGNGARYLRSPHRVELTFESGAASPGALLASWTAFRFDRLPIRGDRTQLAGVIYRETLETASGSLQSVGDNQLRRSWLCLTNGTPEKGYAPIWGFDTRLYPDGDYCFLVAAFDLNGNRSTKRLKLRLRNGRRDGASN